jgi:hypothetical protein
MEKFYDHLIIINLYKIIFKSQINPLQGPKLVQVMLVWHSKKNNELRSGWI